MSPENTQLAILIAAGVILLLLAIWLIMRANRKTTIVDDGAATKDVLDEGAAPAARNHALIDAPSKVEAPSVPAVETEPEPVPAATPVPTSSPDDLRKIKGLGPKLVTLLAEQGVTRFEQIAAWSDADVERVDATLGRFAGRITRDQWVEQAKLLASGQDSAFSEKFGQDG